jgi:NAD(P)-dependent dehydrogenase (short-subunit alcohol dehydrogenase family)
VSALAGRVAVVTGAARDRSIGGGIARVLARHGADVVVNDLAVTPRGDLTTLEELAALVHWLAGVAQRRHAQARRRLLAHPQVAARAVGRSRRVAHRAGVALVS